MSDALRRGQSICTIALIYSLVNMVYFITFCLIVNDIRPVVSLISTPFQLCVLLSLRSCSILFVIKVPLITLYREAMSFSSVLASFVVLIRTIQLYVF